MDRNKDKPYHIDYCFVSIDMLDKLQSVDIGEYDHWIRYSHHVPMIVTFDNGWTKHDEWTTSKGDDNRRETSNPMKLS